jgi:hypothetical protein
MHPYSQGAFSGIKNFASVKTTVVPEPNAVLSMLASVATLTLLHRAKRRK